MLYAFAELYNLSTWSFSLKIEVPFGHSLALIPSKTPVP